MLKYLANLEDLYGPLRVFDSITFRAAVGMVVAFLAALAAGPGFIRLLKRLRVTENMDKPDSAELEKLHHLKRDTPTMGGIILVCAIVVGGVLFADATSPYVWMTLVVLLAFATLGLVDDYVKLRRIRPGGLARPVKLIAQFVLAAGACLMLCAFGDVRHVTHLLVPGTKMAEFYPDLGAMYAPFFLLVLVGSSNAVNLSDGLDGLAAGLVALVALTFTVLAYAAGHAEVSTYLRIPFVRHSGELTVLCATVVGATLGFLWFNAHPARVFMGDTGSLGLGAAIGFAALSVKQELVLLVCGGVFVVEAVSVLLQIASCRTRGKRLLRCAPFHHHLEFSGWHENHVVVRLWCIGIVLAALGLASLKMH